jgi:hypothetical protein
VRHVNPYTIFDIGESTVSTVIIVGGSGHNAITRLVVSSIHATSQQKADAVNLLQKFVDDVNVLCDEMDSTPPK